MALLDFFLSRKKSTANIAKERLQIIVAERRRSDAEPHYLPQLRKDILEVICKYVQIDPEMVTVQLEQKDGDISILELNVTLPEAEESNKLFYGKIPGLKKAEESAFFIFLHYSEYGHLFHWPFSRQLPSLKRILLQQKS